MNTKGLLKKVESIENLVSQLNNEELSKFLEYVKEFAIEHQDTWYGSHGAVTKSDILALGYDPNLSNSEMEHLVYELSDDSMGEQYWVSLENALENEGYEKLNPESVVQEFCEEDCWEILSAWANEETDKDEFELLQQWIDEDYSVEQYREFITQQLNSGRTLFQAVINGNLVYPKN